MVTQIQTRKFTIAEYDQMAYSGVLSEDERVELLEGEIITMNPIRSQHAACVDRLAAFLAPLSIAQRAIVRVQNPIRLGDYSEPQPDLVIARFQKDFYRTAHPAPSDILLVIEVVDTTASYDYSVKLPLYAKAGIQEAWITDLEFHEIIVYTQPTPKGYKTSRRFTAEDQVPLTMFPDLSLPVMDMAG